MEAFEHSPGLRAYLVLDALPAGARTFMVADEMAEPHIHLGELAIVDTNDRELQSGEIYLVRWSSGTERLMSVKYRSTGWVGWWVGTAGQPWGRKRKPGEAPISMEKTIEVAQRWGLVDGPYTEEGLRSRLVGRVIGIYAASVEGPSRLIEQRPGQ